MTEQLTPAEFTLAPGDYNVRATYEDQVLEEDVTIISGETTVVSFNFDTDDVPPDTTEGHQGLILMAVAGIVVSLILFFFMRD